MNPILPVQDTNHIRVADFVRLEGGGLVALINTSGSAITVPEVDTRPFEAAGTLLTIGDVQRDIKATANDTNFTLTGIDTAVLGAVLNTGIKGAAVEMWHGFFNENNELDTSGGVGGLYQFFNGYVTSYSITESWNDNARMLVGTISIAASSSKLILQNRISGRFTNGNSWKFYNSNDTSMDRVAYISSVNYQFGKTA